MVECGERARIEIRLTARSRPGTATVACSCDTRVLPTEDDGEAGVKTGRRVKEETGDDEEMEIETELESGRAAVILDAFVAMAGLLVKDRCIGVE